MEPNAAVQVTTIYDTAFKPANDRQDLLALSRIQTQNERAEIYMGGNQIQLQENTEISLIGVHNDEWQVQLEKGKIKVNAYDQILVKGGRVQAEFSQSLGVSINEDYTQVETFSGRSQVKLLEANQNELNRIVIPAQHMISFANEQLVPEYQKIAIFQVEQRSTAKTDAGRIETRHMVPGKLGSIAREFSRRGQAPTIHRCVLGQKVVFPLARPAEPKKQSKPKGMGPSSNELFTRKRQ
ncbi:hypothetical protein IPJ72_03485 [Candidatus Peregrinibacteria bacterium]|nr:MAG: hypothetical protein IPJ72_03485 [Candidatus Peregrinibacteria bacterium]